MPEKIQELCQEGIIIEVPNLDNSSGISIANKRIREMGPDGILDLSHLKLLELPSLAYTPYLIKKLKCNDNYLTQLDELPHFIESLECQNNKLVKIKHFPYNAIYINCSNNELTTLPKLLSSLYSLDCSNNKLTFLYTQSSPDLTWINCHNNYLTHKPITAVFDARIYWTPYKAAHKC